MTDDYPCEEDLQRIERWTSDTPGWVAFCETVWIQAYGRIWKLVENSQVMTHFATGGWSGNEVIVAAMQANFVMWANCWESSTRGGLHVFRQDT